MHEKLGNSMKKWAHWSWIWTMYIVVGAESVPGHQHSVYDPRFSVQCCKPDRSHPTGEQGHRVGTNRKNQT